jgi:spermidine synthase
VRSIVPLLFFLSGTTALIYEVVWSKYLSHLFGSTIQAQTVVLGIFMGGLALGSRLFGKWSNQIPNGLKAYGLIEIAVGIFGFCFALFHEIADVVFISWGSSFLNHSSALLCLKIVLSLVLLIIPTVLMGGTLPILSSWLESHHDHPGKSSAWFYAMNTLGAVVGAGLAGFVLVRSIGLGMTLWVAALINIIIGFTAFMLSGLTSFSKSFFHEKIPVRPLVSNTAWGSACLFVGLTGALSMSLELLASRALSMIFGASLQAFSTVLMAFILGIGLGSAVVAHRRDWKVQRATILCLLSASLLISLWIVPIQRWIVLYMNSHAGLASNEMGYIYHLVFTALVSVIVIGTPAALLGSVLPLWIRFENHGKEFSNRVGTLITYNTLGGVFGTIFTGFILMPTFGLRNSLATIAWALVFGALWLAWKERLKSLALAGVVLALFHTTWTWHDDENWRHILSAGIFRKRDDHDNFRWFFEERHKTTKLLFYKDGPDATVTVEEKNLEKSPSETEISLRINGKTDASSHGDLSTQYLLAHLPMAARPQSQDVFVLGLGSGITAGAILGHPIHSLEIAENCIPVIEASDFFKKWNRDVLNDTRTHVWMEDARTVLKLSPKKYDVIISEPSNPWTAH